MTDYALEDTFYINFTTRAFATGIPTVLAGSPVISAIENASATPITAGLTLSVDHASVVGLNNITVAATAVNGYESGKTIRCIFRRAPSTASRLLARLLGASPWVVGRRQSKLSPTSSYSPMRTKWTRIRRVSTMQRWWETGTLPPWDGA